MAHNTARSAWRTLAVGLPIVLLAAACGSDDDDASSTSAGEGATSVASSTPGTTNGDGGGNGTGTTAANAEAPQPGGELTYAISNESTGGFCLPEAQLSISGLQVARSVYDTLTMPNAEGEIEPYLAESVEANNDFTQWTITLPKGVTFHDGTPLDAQIVADNINAWRGMYEGRNAPLLPVIFSDVKDVTVVDKRSVQVTTTARPWASFPWHLWGESRLGIIARAQLDGDAATCAQEPIGTGPFSVKEWTVNQKLVAVKNPDCWQTDADGNPLPYLDQITYTPIPEMDQRINALESGQVDVIMDLWGEQLVNRVRPMADSGSLEVYESDRPTGLALMLLNHGAPPFDNKNARLAVAHAFDRDLFNEVINFGVNTIADGPFNGSMVGQLDDNGYPDFDVDKAREYADVYRDETGEELSFTYSFGASQQNTKVGQELQTQLGEAGITLNLDPTGDEATLINKVLNGDFEAVPWGVYAAGDPDGLRHWYYSESPLNVGRINDKELDRLWDEGRSSAEGRDAIYEEANRRFGSEVYHIWFGTGPDVIAARSGVNGIVSAEAEGNWSFVDGHFAHNFWVSP